VKSLLALVLCAWSVSVLAADATPAWTAKGFKQPESALYVAAEKAIFVSNLNGAPDAKDGNGFISRLDDSGKIVKLEWVSGLDAPKGMAYAQGKLFVADLEQLVVIDVKSGAIDKRYRAPGAPGLNDISLEPRSHFKGQVARAYVSDLFGNAIWYLGDNKFSQLVADPAFEAPNGLLVEGETLVIANWGTLTGNGFETSEPGRLKVMKLDEEGIADRFSAIPLGNLDGLESDGKGGYWVSDWLAGRIYRVKSDGSASVALQLEQGTADIGLVPGKWLLVPMMLNDEVRAYALPK
jgi:hypothetical protein